MGLKARDGEVTNVGRQDRRHLGGDGRCGHMAIIGVGQIDGIDMTFPVDDHGFGERSGHDRESPVDGCRADAQSIDHDAADFSEDRVSPPGLEKFVLGQGEDGVAEDRGDEDVAVEDDLRHDATAPRPVSYRSSSSLCRTKASSPSRRRVRRVSRYARTSARRTRRCPRGRS